MSASAYFVLYAVVWFMTFFVILPLRLVTQGDAGSVVPGTPAGAPAGAVVARKARITTVVATLVWAALCAVILSGSVSVRDFDWMGRMGPAPVTAPDAQPAASPAATD